ncbi:MAG TPA: glycosyltransferase [Burkholderiaceae bacterium]|nr:glycosyltransferase [Burkholderiaceae bacterium]
MSEPIAAPRLGAVVIGRNEGERLRRCLESVRTSVPLVVYVDSGSSDGSAELAASLGAVVHALDMRRPFTAARARNEGVQRLAALAPTLEYIQFVDGDCEVAASWIGAAQAFLDAHADVAAVCGRRRERHPERSIYNRLCDIEWDTPIGAAKACGGDVLMRAEALRQATGYRDELIAGEEPELCVRLRAKGWRIWRLDAEMTLHDAAMTRFGQWWRRCQRAGFAYAEGVRLHGAPPERHWVRESRRAWLWGAILPIAIALLAALAGPIAWVLLAIYPAQVARLALRSPRDAAARWARAFFLVAGKFPEAQGQLKAWLSHVRQRRAALIEYK